jgi:hypothetical protein
MLLSQERSTLLEEIWNAEPEYVIPPLSHPLYVNAPSLAEFQPYFKRIRAVRLGRTRYPCHLVKVYREF